MPYDTPARQLRAFDVRSLRHCCCFARSALRCLPPPHATRFDAAPAMLPRDAATPPPRAAAITPLSMPRTAAYADADARCYDDIFAADAAAEAPALRQRHYAFAAGAIRRCH